MDAIDAYIPEPVRDIDKPFLMPIEDVFSISGRGTVVTGRAERGVIYPNTEIEIVGIKPTMKTVATSIEMFRKVLTKGRAGDNIGILLRGTKKEEVERGPGSGEAGIDHPSYQVQRQGIYFDQGRGRAAHPVFHGVSSAVLFPDHGCDGHGRACRRGLRW